jgi:hypothetical protein
MTQPADPPTPPTDPAAPPVATPPAQPAGQPPAPPAATNPDEPLGPAGIKALKAEREAREALEREFAPLRRLAASLAPGDPGAGKTELEQLAARQAEMEKTLADERALRYRAEVAQAKGLTAEQAEWLKGATAEELTASADRLLASFPAGVAPKPGTPAPDPSQGNHGGGQIDIDARIAQAQKDKDYKAVIRLQNEKFANK